MESPYHQHRQPDTSLPRKSLVQSAGTSTTPTPTTPTTTTPPPKQSPYSTDPFAPNYRHICPGTKQDQAEFIATSPLPLRADFFEAHESAEYAENTRAWDQLCVLLRQRGLEDQFMSIMTGRNVKLKTETPTSCWLHEEEESRVHDKVRKLLRDAGEDGELLERAEENFRVGRVRKRVYNGEVGAEALLEAGDVEGYNWFRLSQGLIMWGASNTADTAAGGQEGAAAGGQESGAAGGQEGGAAAARDGGMGKGMSRL